MTMLSVPRQHIHDHPLFLWERRLGRRWWEQGPTPLWQVLLLGAALNGGIIVLWVNSPDQIMPILILGVLAPTCYFLLAELRIMAHLRALRDNGLLRDLYLAGRPPLETYLAFLRARYAIPQDYIIWHAMMLTVLYLMGDQAITLYPLIPIALGVHYGRHFIGVENRHFYRMPVNYALMLLWRGYGFLVLVRLLPVGLITIVFVYWIMIGFGLDILLITMGIMVLPLLLSRSMKPGAGKEQMQMRLLEDLFLRFSLGEEITHPGAPEAH